MPRPRTVYHGKRKYSWIITLAVTLLVVVILLAVWLFYYLQRFIVYDKEGLRLDLSAPREELLSSDGGSPAAQPAFTPVDVEIVVEQRDYSDVVTSAGTDLVPLKAVFVPAAELNENTLKYYASDMGDFNALVLELKGPDGFLRWHSRAELADSFAVNGTTELNDAVAALKEKGVYLAAQLCALTDGAMAQRNAPIALKTASGEVFTEANGYGCLDPYSDGTRSYLHSLLTELSVMGFDEVFLSGFLCPDSPDLRFSLARTQTPTPTEAVTSLALWLRQEADTLGLKLSVVMESDALRSGDTVLHGQDAALLFRVFDRVAAATDFDHLPGDLSALDAALEQPDENRALLITDNYAPERQSYIVR